MAEESRKMDDELLEIFESGEEFVQIPDPDSKDFYDVDKYPDGTYSAWLIDGDTGDPYESAAVNVSLAQALHAVAERFEDD